MLKKRKRQVLSVVIIVLVLPIIGLLAQLIGKANGSSTKTNKNRQSNSTFREIWEVDLRQALAGMFAMSIVIGVVFLACFLLRLRDYRRTRGIVEGSTQSISGDEKNCS